MVQTSNSNSNIGRMNWIQRKILLYNVTFGLYMLDWWERYLFNIMIVVLLWFVCYNGSRSAAEFYTSHLKMKLGMEGLDLNNLIGHQKNGNVVINLSSFLASVLNRTSVRPHKFILSENITDKRDTSLAKINDTLGGNTILVRYLGHYETPIQLERENLKLGYAQLVKNLIHSNFRLD